MQSEVSPLRQSVMLIAIWIKLHRSSWSLIDLIIKLKADCPQIKEYLHVSQYDSLIDTSRMRLAGFNLLTPIRRLPDN
jgi:hypothetical protein